MREAPTGPGSGPKGPPPRGLKPGVAPQAPPGSVPRPDDAGGAGAPARGPDAQEPAPAGAAAQPQATAHRAPGSLTVADLVVATLLLGLGVLVIREAVRMGIGWGSDGPESGFVPFWLAIVLVGCGLFSVVRAVRRRSPRTFVRRDQLVRVLQVLLPAATMVGITPYLGVYVAGGLYMALYMRFAGRYSWPASVALPLAFTLTTFLVFERWFLVPLPKGPLEAWLGY